MSDALNLLLVEDDEALRDAVGLTLEMDGHVVTAVDGGPKALEALEKGQTFDLSRLDSLSYQEFEIAVETIREWRSLRYIQADDPVYSFPLHE